MVKAAIILIVVAGLKEAKDYIFHLPSDWTEYASDFAVTFIYIGIIALVRKVKKMSLEAGKKKPKTIIR